MHYIFLALLFLFSANSQCFAVDNLTSSQRILAEGMRVQSERLKVISENIANSNSSGLTPEDDPYRRKIVIIGNEYDPTLKTHVAKIKRIKNDKSDFIQKYDPHHPAANNSGYVRYPNVNIVLENIDAKEAQRTFEANLTAMEISRTNQMRLLEAMK